MHEPNPEPASAVAENLIPTAPVTRRPRRLRKGATRVALRSRARLRIRPRRAFRRRSSGRPHQPSLFANDGFRAFWISRLLTQTAQGALLYGLFVIVVDRTDSSFYTSLFVICAIVPSLAFGLPAGVVVDSVPRRPLLVGLDLLRFAFALALLSQAPSLAGIFATALGMWTIHQFYSPAESATLASLVPRHHYTAAQALSNLASTLAQLLGFVIFAPLLLKFGGPDSLFAFCAVCFIAGTIAVALLPKIAGEHRHEPGVAVQTNVRKLLLNGWDAARRDRSVYAAMFDDILVGIGASTLVVITPLYLRRVLNTSAENTVFVFAPVAIGLVLGLRMAPRLGRMLTERRLSTIGLVVFAMSVGALGFLPQIETFVTETLRIPLNQIARTVRIPPLILLVMLISIPAGFASSVVNVAARSVLLTHTPAALRGQVIATQSLLQNLGALGPTLLAGVAADVIGVDRFAIAIALTIGVGAIAATTLYRPAPLSAPAG